MHLVQHLRGTVRSQGDEEVETTHGHEPTFPNKLLVLYLLLTRWGEAVTRADQTLYGLRTKALIIKTLQIWLMSRQHPTPPPLPSYTHNTKHKARSRVWTQFVVSCLTWYSVSARRSESLSASLKVWRCCCIKKINKRERCTWSTKPCIFTAGPNLTIQYTFL